MITGLKTEILRLSEPIVVRLIDAIGNANPGIAIYSLLTVAVSMRRETGLTPDDLHKMLASLLETSRELDN